MHGAPSVPSATAIVTSRCAASYISWQRGTARCGAAAADQPGSQQQTRRTAINSYLLSAGPTAANPPYSNRFISPVSRAHSSKPNLSPHEPANYRPISNLCTFSTISEKLVLPRMQPHVMRSATYCKFQSAYRKSHSTETALLRVINDIQMAAGNGQCTALCVGARHIISVR